MTGLPGGPDTRECCVVSDSNGRPSPNNAEPVHSVREEVEFEVQLARLSGRLRKPILDGSGSINCSLVHTSALLENPSGR